MRVAERAEETPTLTSSPESRATAGARPLLQRSVAWSRKLTPFATEIVPLRHANCPRHRTSGYVKSHAVIVLGHLHTKSMTASAAGNIGAARKESQAEVQAEPCHPLARLGRTRSPVGVQTERGGIPVGTLHLRLFRERGRGSGPESTQEVSQQSHDRPPGRLLLTDARYPDAQAGTPNRRGGTVCPTAAENPLRSRPFTRGGCVKDSSWARARCSDGTR